MKRLIPPALCFLALGTFSCNNGDNNESEDANASGSAPLINYTMVTALPHDTSSFTEGLEFYNNNLLESTGNYGKSRLLEIEPQTGKVVKEVKLEPKYFGEGISVLNDSLYQMTYKEQVVFVYSAKDFKKIKELPLKTEGWGMTNNGKELIVSDGSSNLYFYEPGTFRLLRVQAVTEKGNPAVNINELELINGFVYANQWQYNYILKIDPKTGEVVGKLDLTDLVNQEKVRNPYAEVLNGIAYNKATDKVYVTGKNFSQLYEIRFAH
jgi:glutamine cyclotransferase